MENESISKLKKKIDRIKHLPAQERELLVKREELEKQIAITSAEEQMLLKELKLKKTEIDHMLDELEDDLEEEIETLQQKLAEEIIRHYPDEQEHYTHLQSQLGELQESEKKIKAVEAILMQVDDEVEQAIQTWRVSKKRGLLNFLFGPSPASHIAKHLENGRKKAEAAIDLIDTLKLESPFMEELKKALQQYLAETEMMWSYNKFETTIIPIREQIQASIENIDHTLKAVEEKQADNTDALEQWISRFG